MPKAVNSALDFGYALPGLRLEMGNIGYNLENPVGCSEFLLPALKLAVLQVTEHCGVLLEVQQQAEENFLIICKK